MRFEKSFIWTLLSYFIFQLCIDIFLVFWVHCSLLYESLNAQPISFNLFLHLYSLYYCFFAFFVRIYVFIKRCLFNHTFLFFLFFLNRDFVYFRLFEGSPLSLSFVCIVSLGFMKVLYSRYVYIHHLDMQLHFCHVSLSSDSALLYMIGLFLFLR